MAHSNDRLASAAAVLAVCNGLWSTFCVHASLMGMQRMLDTRRTSSAREFGGVDDRTIVVVVPVLHEADRVRECAAHWSRFLEEEQRLRLCFVTTERERAEMPDQQFTWDAILSDPRYERLAVEGRANIMHYPSVNRTYAEQLGWALDQLADDPEIDYFYVSNADSRLSADGCAEIVELANSGIECAQQSALFFAKLSDATLTAVGEAFYQSRWTFEIELFRYMAGSGKFRWLPRLLSDNWYQHAVGHGLLLRRTQYELLGRLPRPRYGLEDAALGFAIRAHGGRIRPFATLECGEPPASARELQRQRATWIRGPLCAPEYVKSRREAGIAAQAIYSGCKWAFGIPAQWALLAALPARQRRIAAAGLVLGLYGPIFRLLIGVRGLEIVTRPSGIDIARGLTGYPVAAVSCWLGGFRGLCRLFIDLAYNKPAMQQRTRGLP